MRFRVGGRKVTAGPGETVIVPPGTVHHFANAGRGTAHVAVETLPALQMEPMLVTAAALAQDHHASGRPVPRLVDLALFMDEFAAEVRASNAALLSGGGRTQSLPAGGARPPPRPGERLWRTPRDPRCEQPRRSPIRGRRRPTHVAPAGSMDRRDR